MEPQQEGSYEKRGEVFVKTENISDKKETDKIKERLSAQREKRRIMDKLSKTKGLADSDSEEEDVVSWVDKSRQLEKLKAEEKERQLEEMDRQIQDEMERKTQQEIQRQTSYQENDLRGMTVSHSVDAIKEGRAVILTLKDKAILDDEDEERDILENVNIVDEEKAAKNVNNKKMGKTDYNPYEVEDDTGPRNLLSKYNETIDGEKKESFKIGSQVILDKKQLLEQMQRETMSGKMKFSLDEESMTLASDYYTKTEMEQFKKPKKIKGNKRKMIRKRVLEEEIIPLAAPTSTDLGLRGNRSGTSNSIKEGSTHGGDNNYEEFLSGNLSSPKKIDVSIIKKEILEEQLDESDDEGISNDQVDRSLVLEDEADRELEEALERARRMKGKQRKENFLNKIVEEIVIERGDDDNQESMHFKAVSSTTTAIVMDSTAEFCRNLGEVSSQQLNVQEESDDSDNGVMEDDKERMLKMGRNLENNKRPMTSTEFSTSTNRTNDWREVDLEAEEEDFHEVRSNINTPKKKECLKSLGVFEEEVDVSVGVAAALRLAMTKGYLEKDAKKCPSLVNKKDLEAKEVTIESKFSEDEKRRHHYERYTGGPIQEFKDKPNYKPDVKLDYVDDNGRILSSKEAFRTLSHKFHGKGPGKNKIDKREQKLQKESKLRQMSSIDTPLNTVHKLQEKTKELQVPYVVISGSATSLIKK
jgi:U4/U6.U5 tri-snRNP-associated protein 1